MDPKIAAQEETAAEAGYEEFLRTVEQGADVGRGEAEQATRAVLETLAERLSKGQARHLAEQLPPRVAAWLATDSGAQAYEVEEFLRRVAERRQVDLETAERYVRAVFMALGRTVADQELADMEAELPKSFAPFLPKGPTVEVMPVEPFIARVADRAGIDEGAAAKAAAAVLETLAERISGGEVEDLLQHLPPELHEPLRRGDALSDGAARRMSLDQFVERIAEREGVSLVVAHEHARAVFATLREALPDKEWRDVLAQLPDDYAALRARP
jgi:uncharacterized protein (DUF2267 family)